jgi:hypothetical protein
MSLRERPAFLRASVIAGTGPAKIIFDITFLTNKSYLILFFCFSWEWNIYSGDIFDISAYSPIPMILGSQPVA